jgi:hypothetical protein
MKYWADMAVHDFAENDALLKSNFYAFQNNNHKANDCPRGTQRPMLTKVVVRARQLLTIEDPLHATETSIA